MEDPNIIMEEYIRPEEEKARRRGEVYNWETATYGKIWYVEDVHDLRYVETEFPAIVFDDAFTSEVAPSYEPTVSPFNDNKIDFRISFDESDDEDYTVIYNENSFSYKIISVNDLKMDSKNDNDKVKMPSFLSPEPEFNYYNDLDFFKYFEKEFSVIVYNDALTSKSDFLTEPTTQKPKKPTRKDTQVPQPSGLTESVTDKVVHKELGDRLVRDATTTSSLEAEHDGGAKKPYEIQLLKLGLREHLNNPMIHCSQEGRMINAIDADKDITLVSAADNEMFDVDVFGGKEIRIGERKEKRAGEELIQEITKKQKVEDDKEIAELKQFMETIPDEEKVAINSIPLAVKSLRIVDWKIHKEGQKRYYQIVRADGKAQMYMIFSQMLKTFN
nr:hypothetical protein [Tanacetum cinerariifolium]